MLSHACQHRGRAWHWAGAVGLSFQKPPLDALQEGTQVPLEAPLPPQWLWGLALAYEGPLQRAAEGSSANLATLIPRGGAHQGRGFILWAASRWQFLHCLH